MDTDEYWSLVEQAHSAVPGESDAPAVAERLVDLLAALEPDRIVEADTAFRRISAQGYTWQLWGAAYVINGGCSDDGFDYFRGWLVAQGRQVFEAALADPDSLADVVDDEVEADGEDILGAPWDAYRRVAGADLPSGRPVPLPDLGEGWDFDDESEMRRRYPRLTEMFF